MVNPLFPHATLVLQTPLSPDQIQEALAPRIRESPGLLVGPDPVQVWRGAVRPDGFSLSPVPRGRNSWNPQCEGRYAPLPGGGTEVTVEMKPHPFIVAFGVIWETAAVLAAIGACASLLPALLLTPMLIVLILPLFLPILTILGFSMGTDQAERQLREALGA